MVCSFSVKSIIIIIITLCAFKLLVWTKRDTNKQTAFFGYQLCSLEFYDAVNIFRIRDTNSTKGHHQVRNFTQCFVRCFIHKWNSNCILLHVMGVEHLPSKYSIDRSVGLDALKAIKVNYNSCYNNVSRKFMFPSCYNSIAISPPDITTTAKVCLFNNLRRILSWMIILHPFECYAR